MLKRQCLLKATWDIPNEFGSMFGINDLELDLTSNVKGRMKGKRFTGMMYSSSVLSTFHGVLLTYKSLGIIGSSQNLDKIEKGKDD